MKLASLHRLPNAGHGTPLLRDGSLVLVSTDLRWAVSAAGIVPTLLGAIEDWAVVEAPLRALAATLNAGQADGMFAFDPAAAAAPLPRAAQWCDASAFLNHGRLMDTAFNMPPIPDTDTIPLMYQGASDDFLGPRDDVPLPDEAHGIDFEGEFGVVTGEVPLGATASQAAACIRLVVQINDVSLRSFGPREMRTGFGFIHAKPSSSFAPVAVTPDELGLAWRDHRVHLPLAIDWNGERFGAPHGRDMHFGFDALIAHAVKTRRLRAGSIVGSGTVSNEGAPAGSACIAERRAIEILRDGRPSTPFMRFGDRVRMEARTPDGGPLFGAIDQRIVQAQA